MSNFLKQLFRLARTGVVGESLYLYSTKKANFSCIIRNERTFSSLYPSSSYFVNSYSSRGLRTAAWQTYMTPEFFPSSPLRNQKRLFGDIDRSNKKQDGDKDEKDKDQKDAISIEHEDDSKLTLAQRFKKMWKQYWYVLLPVHAATCCAWFGLFYAISVSGLDVIGFLEMLHIPERIMEHIRNAPQAGHLVVTLALYKIVTPLRYMSTLGVTYYAVKSLSRLGYIKPMPNRKQLKAIYDQKRDQFQVRRHRWRQERRFLVFKRRPQASSNSHHQQQPKKPPHD